jgi:phytoene synthase
MTPQEYCQNKAAASGSSFYYSFRFLPEQKRHAIIALYAFCREVDDVVDETSDVNLARVKLQWWRDEIKNLFHGTPTHPVTLALKDHLPHFNFAEELFYEIIAGMEMDLDYDSYPTFKELSLYCYRVASVVGLLTVEIFGYEDRKTLKYAHDLGMAFQLTNILRDVHEDAVRGRVYLPLDELERFGVKPEDLQKNITNENIVKLFEFQKNRALEYYKKAFDLLPASDRYAQRSGVIMAEIYLTTLQEIEKDGYRVLEHRIKLTPLRKLWLAWKTARREKKKYKNKS